MSWHENRHGGESCHNIDGIKLDTTFDETEKLPFGWEVEIGDFYAHDRAETLYGAKIAAVRCADDILVQMQAALRELRA